MTPKSRKIVSKSLMDLFAAREQEYKAILNEKEETITQYDTGDDAAQRELHKEVGTTLTNALNEIEMLDNYTITRTSYYHRLLEFSDINIGTKFWDQQSLVRNDNSLLWSMLPEYTNNGSVRAIDVINPTPYLYSNIMFNCSDNGPGLNEPFVNNITINEMIAYDNNEVGNPRNFKRLYNAFNDLKAAFISNGAYVSFGNTSVPSGFPIDPLFTPGTYNKISIKGERKNLLGDYDPPVESYWTQNTYVVCATTDLTTIKIGKIYSVFSESELDPSTSNEYMYSFDMQVRLLSDINGQELYVKRFVPADNAYRVFEELKNIYVLHSTAVINYLVNIPGVGSFFNEMHSFRNTLNSIGSMSDISNVNLFYTAVTNFNTSISNRVTSLNSVINNTDFLDDIKSIVSLRASKSSGTLFDIFRKIEGIDALVSRYNKGSSRIDYLKKKAVVTKAVQNPDNNYTILAEEKVNECYNSTGQNINVGDSVYIIDEIRPELLVQVTGIGYTQIEDIDSNNINASDTTTAVKLVTVKEIKTNRIISKDFDTSEALRIVKQL